jgi:glycosyltransferase involved in cell wall biosynthesis
MLPPLRIAHLTGTVNGAPWMVALAREQIRLGHRVDVIIPPGDGTIGASLAGSGVNVHTLPLDVLGPRNPITSMRVLLRLARLLRRLRPDVVHSHIITSVVTGRLGAWLADVPVRLGGNTGPLTLESDLLRTLELGTIFCDTRTIASCNYSRELYHRHGIADDQIELVYYAIEQNDFDPANADGARLRRELGLGDDVPLIGMVAYFYPPSTSAGLMPPHLIGRSVKGHDVFLRAVPEVLAMFPNAQFVFAGRGWGPGGDEHVEEMKDLARTLGVAGVVHFLGERKDVPDVLAALDISVHCSLTDNLGGTTESLLMGKPMVVSDIGGFADTVLHEETGIVVPRDNPPALAAALLRLLRDRPLAQRLGESGRRWMLERFTVKRSAADLEELFARIPIHAERHYRLFTSVKRALTLPFRLWPVYRALVALQPKQPLWRRLLGRSKRAVRGVVKPPLGSRASRPPSASTGRVRIAQVAAARENCQWLVDLSRDLTTRGYEVVAIIDDVQSELGDRLTKAGIRVFAAPMLVATNRDRGRLPFFALQIPIAAVCLARILRRERIDVVHSHVFISVFVARFAAALARTRHVAMISGPRHLEAPLTRIADRLTWWLDDLTVAGCRYTRDIYASLGANAERLTTIYYGADTERFDPARADGAIARRELGFGDDTPLVTLVAHFYAPTSGAQTPEQTRGRGLKGHDDFLKAARIIVTRMPDVRFVMAGLGVMDRGETFRQRLIDQCRDDALLHERVLFTGYHRDVPSLLAASDVAVQCSLTENLGGTIEALLMECPVVATRVGGMPEAVRDGETGLLVPPSDPDALAAAILRLLDNRQEAAAFGRAGRRLMLERFTWQRTVDDVEHLYRRLESPSTAVAPPLHEARGKA